jgi:hypothetical protein
LGNDHRRNSEAQARPALFSRKEGIEDLILMLGCDAAAFVPDVDVDTIRASASRKPNGTATGACLYGVYGEIQQYLLHLFRVTLDFRQPPIELLA